MLKEYLLEANQVIQSFLNDSSSFELLAVIIDCYLQGAKVMIFGNGGSAPCAQHFAGELVSFFILTAPNCRQLL